MNLKDIRDLCDSRLVDVAEGFATTAFIFKRKDGSLTGFKVKSDAIELCDFKEKGAKK